MVPIYLRWFCSAHTTAVADRLNKLASKDGDVDQRRALIKLLLARVRRKKDPSRDMEDVESMIAEARQTLLAGPAASAPQRRNLQGVIAERLPRAVELLQRQPMGAAAARRCARTFTVVQDFVDTCLRSPLLGEGGDSSSGSFLDLSPLLHVLRVLVSADAVPPRFLSAAEAAAVTAAAGGLRCFNREHGKPLLRACHGRSKRIWPDEPATRCVSATDLCRGPPAWRRGWTRFRRDRRVRERTRHSGCPSFCAGS